MALAEPAIVREDSLPPTAPARRSLMSRLSIGHVVMILAGLIAILLNLAFLRSGSETISIAVADTNLPAGTTLEAGTITTIEVGDAGALAAGLLTDETIAGLYGSILARGIEAGEPIRRSDLRPAGTTSTFREYSIEVERAEAAGGRISKSDVVDVIAVIDNRAFYVASGIDVIDVTSDSSGLGSGAEQVIILSVDDRTALEIESARAAGTIAVVRSTGAAPPTSGPVSVLPTEQP